MRAECIEHQAPCYCHPHYSPLRSDAINGQKPDATVQGVMVDQKFILPDKGSGGSLTGYGTPMEPRHGGKFVSSSLTGYGTPMEPRHGGKFVSSK